MRLSELFAVEDVIVQFDPADKWDAIARLIGHLVRREKIGAGAARAITDAVVARERSMSTGMEHGIAIPHAAVDEVEQVVAALGIVQRPEGLAFESIDGRPTRVVVLLVIPRAHKLLHIRTLADIARVLSRESVRESLVTAGDASEAWSALVEGDAARR